MSSNGSIKWPGAFVARYSADGTLAWVRTTRSKNEKDDYAMASRYLGPELGKWYVQNNPSTSESVLVRLTPETWLTCDFGKGMGGQR